MWRSTYLVRSTFTFGSFTYRQLAAASHSSTSDSPRSSSCGGGLAPACWAVIPWYSVFHVVVPTFGTCKSGASALERKAHLLVEWPFAHNYANLWRVRQRGQQQRSAGAWSGIGARRLRGGQDEGILDEAVQVNILRSETGRRDVADDMCVLERICAGGGRGGNFPPSGQVELCLPSSACHACLSEEIVVIAIQVHQGIILGPASRAHSGLDRQPKAQAAHGGSALPATPSPTGLLHGLPLPHLPVALACGVSCGLTVGGVGALEARPVPALCRALNSLCLSAMLVTPSCP